MKHKMYCIFAAESVDKVKNRGKLGTQAGHAYLHAGLKADPIAMQAYLDTKICYKITLVVDTIADLEALQAAYAPLTSTYLVKDAGLTVFGKPTVTCLGIGPITEDLVGPDISRLKLFK